MVLLVVSYLLLWLLRESTGDFLWFSSRVNLHRKAGEMVERWREGDLPEIYRFLGVLESGKR
jgi:hypothetical protein